MIYPLGPLQPFSIYGSIGKCTVSLHSHLENIQHPWNTPHTLEIEYFLLYSMTASSVAIMNSDRVILLVERA